MAELNNSQIEDIKKVIENVSREFNLLCLQDFLTKEVFRINQLAEENERIKEDLSFIYRKLMDHLKEERAL
jgi:archaellum component FlaC